MERGELEWSSAVFEVIRTISSQFIFLYEKPLNAQKHKSSKKQLTKQKQANKKQQRQRFSRTKMSKKGKIVCFAFAKKLKLLIT